MGMVEWNDDKAQFARLICEIVATCYDIHWPDICASMDITEEELQDLLDRAETVWTEAKEKVTQRLQQSTKGGP